ncbi:MAG: hypothetical protein JMDDDDMK_05574 [Acidobacteria bacterium]|nr:hypothetical protein [Acidobacteriota bacterium]
MSRQRRANPVAADVINNLTDPPCVATHGQPDSPLRGCRLHFSVTFSSLRNNHQINGGKSMTSKMRNPFLVGLALLFMTLAGFQTGAFAKDDDDCCPRRVYYPAPQPICCPAPQPVCCPAPQPVCCPAPQPVVCTAPEPVSCPAPQPVCVTQYVPQVRTISYSYMSTPAPCSCH